MGREIGRGSSGVVREGHAKGEDNSKVAMKFINKQKWPTKYSAPKDLLHEEKILQELEHPCITKVIEAIDDLNMVVIGMEYAAGREMFDYVVIFL